MQLCHVGIPSFATSSLAEDENRHVLQPEGDSRCPLCELATESIDHLFVTRPVTWKLWSCFLDLMGVSWVCPGSWTGVMEYWFHSGLRSRRKLTWNTIPTVVLWSIWKERNMRVFEGTTSEFSGLFQNAKWRLCLWLCANKEFMVFKAGNLLQSW